MRICPKALLLPLLAALTACGGAAEPAAPEARPAAEAAPPSPWDTLPAESIYGATAEENLRVVRVEIPVLDLPRGWDGMRIAAISDLQLGLWEGNDAVVEQAARRAVAERPDLIVLLGDYVATGTDLDALTRALEPLRGQRVLAVLGDRDVRSDSAKARVRVALGELGIRVLINDAVPFGRNGDTAWVAGLDPELGNRGIAEQEYIVAITGGPRTPLLLTHSPISAARAPQGRRPAILAGNTFCGRVSVPGTPRLTWYRTQALPNAGVPDVERLFRIRNNTLFVTCGVGYSFLPVRLGAPPEVALVTLRSMTAEEEEDLQPDTVVSDTILARFGVGDTVATPPPATGTGND